MKWTLTADRPVYLQLIEQMQRLIAAGEWPAGDKMPSVRELAADAQVNPNTMQRALQELEACGLVITQRTAGRTVTEDAKKIAKLRAEIASQQARVFLQWMQGLGYSRGESISLLQEMKEEER
ncbi:MAG: GntR family transcriptional regulator [Ruthenibacterium sp.]